MKTAISVIIPVYNQETYIRQCLDSVCQQTFRDFEIICVDDGSTDQTAQILTEYQNKDARIRIVNQPNSGAGHARNHGMAKANGDFLVFWDSDDWFEPDALETMYLEITKNHADICVCGVEKYDNATGQSTPAFSYLKFWRLPLKPVFHHSDIPKYIYNFTTNVPWNKMFRSSFVQEQHLIWQELPRSNDTFFVMSALTLADKICITKKRLINYRINNPNSLMGSVSANPLCVAWAYEKTYQFLMEQHIFTNEQMHISFCNKVLDSFLYVLSAQTSVASFEELYRYFKQRLYPRFGFSHLTAQDYTNQYQYQQLCSICSLPVSEYLLTSWKETKNQNVKLKAENRDLVVSRFRAFKFLLKKFMPHKVR